MKHVLIAALITVFLGFPLYAKAQEMAAEDSVAEISKTQDFYSKLVQLNRIKPLQNPRFEGARDILDRRVMDRRSKVVGEVKDLLLDNLGQVSSLSVVFNRLHLRQDIFLSYEQMSIQGMADGYVLAMRSEEIKDMYPELLAGIETAAGDGSLVSLKTVKGLTLRNARGKKIGRIDDVLFSRNGRRAEALYVEVDYGTIRNVGIAIPYDSVTFREKRRRLSAILDKEEAATLIEFAKER